jgi:hypothetical protein
MFFLSSPRRRNQNLFTSENPSAAIFQLFVHTNFQSMPFSLRGVPVTAAQT